MSQAVWREGQSAYVIDGRRVELTARTDSVSRRWWAKVLCGEGKGRKIVAAESELSRRPWTAIRRGKKKGKK